MNKLPDRLVSFIRSAVPSPLSNDNPLLDYLATLGASSVVSSSSDSSLIEVDEIYLSDDVISSIKGGMTIPPGLLSFLSGKPIGYTVLVNVVSSNSTFPGMLKNNDIPIITNVTNELIFYGAKKKDNSLYVSYKKFPRTPTGQFITSSTLDDFRIIHSENLSSLWDYINSLDPLLSQLSDLNNMSPRLILVTSVSPYDTDNSIFTLSPVYASKGEFLILADGIVKLSRTPLLPGGPAYSYNFSILIPNDLTGNISIYGWIGAP